MKPCASSARTRRQHGAADRPTRLASSALVRRPSVCSSFRMARSNLSSVSIGRIIQEESFLLLANLGMKSKHLSAPGSYTVRHTGCGRPGRFSSQMPPTRWLSTHAGDNKMNAPLPEHIRRALETVTLDDKYSLDHGRAFMSGVQALVKLPMLQRQRDALQGKNTAGFISGYRGSPLGGYDQALQKAAPYLKQQNIVFQPGVNEELAATALWGTQQLGFAPPGSNKFDGVFGIWYGKGPGVDRCSDVFKHANMAGTTPWGGVIAVAGDDHVAK